jgi:hypothetical protein|tara:strand:- start:154 stop:471 length:318 start_codon:yes stop_codon:yes gene_type:complete
MKRPTKKNFQPKCLADDDTAMKQLGYSATGHILPCCWCDNGDPGFEAMLTEELKIENNDNIEDIFKSKVWQTFAKKLDIGKGLPHTCMRYCGKGKKYIVRRVEKL